MFNHSYYHEIYICMDILRNSMAFFKGHRKTVMRRLGLKFEDPSDHVLDSAEAQVTLQKLHNAFGGELWVNDQLLHKDGEQVSQDIRNEKSSVWHESEKMRQCSVG